MKNLKIISRDNLMHNIKCFEGKKICAMVKCNAYGHGMKEIVTQIQPFVESFGVVSVDEAHFVRKFTEKPILVCSKIHDFRACKKFGLDIMVEDELDLRKAVKCGLENNLNLKINCGMNRFGAKSVISLRQFDDFLRENDIKLKSIYTHFPCTENRARTKNNYQKFLELRNQISQKAPICFGGSGIFDYDFDFDILRLGIGLYGYGDKFLKPVMSVCSYVNKIFFAKKGEFVGYGKKYRVGSEGFFAVVPIGYGDGLRRALGGNFCVKIGGKKYRAVGNICMDAFFVKIDEKVKIGDRVEVMWNAQEFAKKCGTISYEILTGFSNLRGKTIVE